uniref:Uncharacterized protein n=1 Tax=Romanomermis culicivorax TaxID=13658 RepID=A0A915IQ84_ROMCU
MQKHIRTKVDHKKTHDLSSEIHCMGMYYQSSVGVPQIREVVPRSAILTTDRKMWSILECSTSLFRRSGTDREQLETFSLKIHFRLERITAILLKTTDGCKGHFERRNRWKY